MASVAWIGLGAMGGRMARRLLDAGHDLTVYNRSPERAEPLAAAGATVAGSPADAVRAVDVVFTMVTDPEALRAVIGGQDGVAAGIRPGAVVIDSSTVGPAEVARLPASLPPGTGVLDAPVLGSIGEAESGTLKIFVGGPGRARRALDAGARGARHPAARRGARRGRRREARRQLHAVQRARGAR